MNIKKTALGLGVLALVAAGVWFSRPYWQAGDAENHLTLYGNVDIRQISLAFEGNDRVAEMRVYEGDHVKAGQVLAVLDSQNNKLKLAQAQAQAEALKQSLAALRNGNRPEEIRQSDANMKAAQAQAEQAQLQLRRLQNTAADSEGAVSKQDLDAARAQYKEAQAKLEASRESLRLMRVGTRKEDIARAEAQLKAAQAEAALLQYNIDQSELKAPQNAVVRARLLEPGDMASPQRPAYTLALTEPKWVRAYVNEPQLGKIRPGMKAQVRTDSAPDKPIAGRIGYISSVAEFTPKTVQTTDLRTDLVYEIRVLVDDPQDSLRLGMPATVDIDLQQSADNRPSESRTASGAH